MNLQYGDLLRIGEVKASGDGMEVSGYISTYGNVDAVGDVVMPGAFDAALAGDRKLRLLLGHDQRMVLGLAQELKSDERGVWGRFAISKTQLGQDTHTLLKDGALDSFSIGYIPTLVEFDDVGHRLLKQIDLLEASVVAVPANDRAVVTAVKALDTDVPLDRLMAQIARNLESGAAEAEALAARRAADERKLSDAHVQAIKSLKDAAEAAAQRLANLVDEPAPSGGMALRLELARRRLIAAGVLEHTT